MPNKLLLAILVCLMLQGCSPVMASYTKNHKVCGSSRYKLIKVKPINLHKLVKAIGKAENSRKHPYGIMTRYKSTTPRQACLNTVSRAFKDYQRLPRGSQTGFIGFLQRRYAPTQGIGLRPAEWALNRFWSQNVLYFYNKGV